MAITGHKTRSAFDRYDIANDADLRAGLSQLANAKGAEKGRSSRVNEVLDLDGHRNHLKTKRLSSSRP